jgi:enamine deaminase RidA (YjgF/YER057c/UK114 family)
MTDQPYAVRPVSRRAFLSSTGRGNARQAVGVISPGCRVVGLTKGQFSLLDVIAAVLEQVGPASVTVSTWTQGKAEIAGVAKLLQAHKITDFRLLVDRSFVARQPSYIRQIQARIGADAIRQTKTHAKFALIAAGDYRITIRTSMNFNHNSRLEQFDLDDDPDIYNFFNDAVDRLFIVVPAGANVTHAQVTEGFRHALPEEPTEGESMGGEWADVDWEWAE